MQTTIVTTMTREELDVIAEMSKNIPSFAKDDFNKFVKANFKVSLKNTLFNLKYHFNISNEYRVEIVLDQNIDQVVKSMTNYIEVMEIISPVITSIVKLVLNKNQLFKKIFGDNLSLVMDVEMEDGIVQHFEKDMINETK